MGLFEEQNFTGQKLVENVIYLTPKGAFQLVKSKLFTYVDEIKDYVQDSPTLTKRVVKYNIGKVPFKTINTVWNFLQAVYAKTKTEVAVMLWFNSKTKDWLVEVPTQSCTGAHVSYDRDSEEARKENAKLVKKGYVLAGSIHSHAGMTAFHSGTDDADELQFDGLHMTMGNFNTVAQTFSQRIVAGTMEKKIDFFEMVHTDSIQEQFTHEVVPKEWLDKVTVSTVTLPTPPPSGNNAYKTGDTSRYRNGSLVSTAEPLKAKKKTRDKFMVTTRKKVHKMGLSKKKNRFYLQQLTENELLVKCQNCCNLSDIGEYNCTFCETELTEPFERSQQIQDLEGHLDKVSEEMAQNEAIEEEYYRNQNDNYGVARS